MKQTTKLIAALSGLVLIVAGAAAAYGWHLKQMKTLRTELTTEYETKRRLEERIDEITAEKASLKSQNQSQSSQLQSHIQTIKELKQQVSDFAKQIDELMTEEVVVFDVETFSEEIKDISELATVEYRYTNIGAMDDTKKFSFIDVKKPFSDKFVIIQMDGAIKVGTDLSKVKIDCDEAKKVITIAIPKSEILSNEPFEDSFEVLIEKDSLWNPISLKDDNVLRAQIKEKAEQGAHDNHLFEEADSRAQQLIQKMIEALPGIKDTYKIEFRKAA